MKASLVLAVLLNSGGAELLKLSECESCGQTCRHVTVDIGGLVDSNGRLKKVEEHTGQTCCFFGKA